TSALTAISNDYGFEQVFARQVDALGATGDVLIAISTSGTSKNVVAAAAAARARGMHVIALVGGRGAGFAADVVLAMPSPNTARIQELHITLGHILCDYLDEAFAARTTNGVHASREPKLYTLPELIAWREAARARKKPVVWTNGVFDLL